MVDWPFNGKYIFQRMIPRFSELTLALLPVKLVLVPVGFQGENYCLFSFPFWPVKNFGSISNTDGIVNMHIFFPIELLDIFILPSHLVNVAWLILVLKFI